jgi:hypothetical protein
MIKTYISKKTKKNDKLSPSIETLNAILSYSKSTILVKTKQKQLLVSMN